MQVGDLVRVKLPSVKSYIGIVVSRPNTRNGALVRSIDGKYEYWVNSWSGKVLNASR